MTAIAESLAHDYQTALREYVLAGDDSYLEHAYRVGERAMAAGKHTRDLAFIHQNAIVDLCQVPLQEHEALAERIASFFAKSLLPFEGGGAFPMPPGAVHAVDGPAGGSSGRTAELEWIRVRIQEGAARPSSADSTRWLSALLAEGLDYRKTLHNVARLAVETMADGCVIDVVVDAGCVHRLSVIPSDGLETGVEREPVFHFSTRNELGPALEGILSSGEAVVTDGWEGLGPELSAEHRPSEGPPSVLVVPMRARGRDLGTMTLFSVTTERRYSSQDVASAEQFAAVCALALDNARAHETAVKERDRFRVESRDKEEFLAMLGHELKNFLTPIQGWTEALDSSSRASGGELARGIATIASNVKNIDRLVQDCLDTAKLRQGRLEIERELLDLNEVARSSAEAVSKSAERSGLRLELHACESELWVTGDRVRLRQVLMNLLTNAVKHTEKGGSVELHTRREGERALTEVRDTGRGMLAEEVRRIFEPFKRTSGEAGLGLGLALAKKLVELHEGAISVESAGRGCGSLFRVSLPISEPRPASAAATAPEASTPPRRRRLLLIEDRSDILTLMKLEMEQLGYVVSTASDGHSGLETALRERPDVVVSDIKMPELDGLELIRRMRRVPELTGIPAIALTGLGMKQDVEEALACGYHAHLPKPIDASELSAIIESLPMTPEEP